MPARPIRRQKVRFPPPAANFWMPASGRRSSGGKKGSSTSSKPGFEKSAISIWQLALSLCTGWLNQRYPANVMLSEPHRASGDGESKHLAFRPDKHKVLRLALASLSSVHARSG